MGGGTSSGPFAPTPGIGLSPRGRGNRKHRNEPIHQAGSIPAWAGEPFTPVVVIPMNAVYPRVGGGTTVSKKTVSTVKGQSPRGRGNLPLDRSPTGEARSIPAWAGEPSS